MTNNDSIGYEWVIARYHGDSARDILALAHSTAKSYYITEQGMEDREKWVSAAFKRAITGPTPLHLSKVTDPFLIEKLEKWVNPFYKEDKETKPYGEINRGMFPAKETN